ncbi:MAG: hypothetical protein ABIJ96_11580 [Elusimicrobiota bacterium]
MKKLLFFILIFFSGNVYAQDQFGRFQEFIDRESLKPFTRDLGSILGAATFHSGRSLGFSGFDIGVRGGMQFYPSKGNSVLRKNGIRMFGLPWAQAEIGLPLRLDGYIRGISYQGFTIAGGGLRYGLTKKSDKPLMPQFLLAASAHSVSHTHFSAGHFGANLISSISWKIVTVYLGGGFDRTRVVVRSVPTLDATLKDASVTTMESRFTAGASFSPKPYLYVHTGYTLTHGQSGLDSGVGIRF